jgi:hypothetical protein
LTSMLELLGVERVPERSLILGVFKVLKSYVGRSPLIQVLLVLGDECWLWNGRVSYQTKSNIQLGVSSMTGDRIDWL